MKESKSRSPSSDASPHNNTVLDLDLCRRGPHEALLVLVRELLERLLLRLGQQQRREDTREHEEGQDLNAEMMERISAALLRRESRLTCV